MRQDFEAFLASTLGGPAESAAADADLKSRLLDQFLDDEMLLTAAIEAGIKVSDEDVRAFEPEDKIASAAPASRAVDAAAIRRILMTRNFKQKVILADLNVSEDEVRKYFERHLDEYREPARVVLRQILVDDKRVAHRIHDEVARDPSRFEEVAETRSLAPDGGRAFSLEESLLPEMLRGAIDRLKPGELSPVVEDPQGFFVLRLEERQPEKAASLETARQRIELKLLQDLGQRRFDDFMADLRGRMHRTINRDKLGFEYVERSRS